MNIKQMVKDKNVVFDFYRDGELWYKTEDGFSFPVPTNDVGKGIMKSVDKAIYYMRWIRKHLNSIEEGRNA